VCRGGPAQRGSGEPRPPARGGRPRLEPAHPHAGGVHEADRAERELGVRDRPPAGAEQPPDALPAGPHARWQHVDQRDDLHPGNRLDYDGWRDLGNEGWGYDGVLPYFRKSENNERLADAYHGTGGPLNVTDQVGHNPISKGFVRAAQSVGIPFSHDFNGAEQAGVGFYDVTQRNVRRESSATAFLGPARKRKNLTIATHAQATQLLIENGRAVGVRYLANGKPTEARVEAGGEVVSSGGAVNSPRLLLLSGIGPPTSSGRSASRWSMTCPAWARTSRTTWMST
jgi:hypothetical protein